MYIKSIKLTKLSIAAVLCCFILLINIEFNAYAENLATVSGATVKLAVVDWTEITMNYKWFQDQFIKLADKRKNISDMVEKENIEITALENELKRIVIQDDYRSKQAEITKRKSELDAFNREALDLLTKKEEQLLVESKKRIMDAIADIAVRDGIGLVFSKEQVLYAAESYYSNMTAKVIRKLNEEQKK